MTAAALNPWTMSYADIAAYVWLELERLEVGRGEPTP